MDQKTFSTIQPSLPNEPGIYKYYGEHKNLLYIGKAKNIRKRVSSYFTKQNHSFKTAELVRQIRHIEFTIVHSEHDALLLENALIKQFRPKFNIELKDDKTYPYIVIKKEPFPRVFLTRRKINDGSEYLGPYTSATKARELLQLIKQHIPIRNCTLNLTDKNIRSNKFKVCLEYHLGNCKAPCVGFQSAAAYAEGLVHVKHLLKGNLNGIIEQHKAEQKKCIEELAFEKANLLQQKINDLKTYKASSVVVNPRLGDLDVFATAGFEEQTIVSFLSVRNGTIVNADVSTFLGKMDEPVTEILPQAILTFQDTYGSEARELVVPMALDFGFEDFIITVPKTGDKKKLLDLAQTNANYFVTELKRKEMLHLGEEGKDKMDLLASLQQALSLKELPVHIECFDNSNFQGSYPVSAMVCFRNGVPSKNDYRHFNVKTVEGINDFATMKEAVKRRYSRLKSEGQSLPQLVIIDGGKGQLGAALEAIEELSLKGEMTLIGLAKNVEEVFFAGDRESLKLGFQSNTLRFLRNIRDEVHRFGISFHRSKRSKGTFSNELEKIQGIGPKTISELLLKFRSVQKIKEATEEEISAVIGTQKARLVSAHLNSARDPVRN